MIDRLLVLKLDAIDCEAEALLNGIPVARASPARPRIVVPVHEYTAAGANRLELVIWPRAFAPGEPKVEPPLPCVSTGRLSAHARILLPRVGNVADESTARTLAQMEWSPVEGLPYEAPFVLSQDISLQVSFPRWRWMDAPVVPSSAALRSLALSFVDQLSQQLAAGDVEGFITATRLRTEELAAAYQRDAGNDAARMRSHLLELHATHRLKWLPMTAEGLVLRSLAGGRLHECLDISGAPMLRTVPDDAGRVLALPLRVAAVDNRLYVLR